MKPKTTFILGCTGCGKGTLGRELARRTGGEIVSLDSMKVYRRMDIGTAKPSVADRRDIPHHLIDVVEPSEEFSVARYVQLVERAIADIEGRGRPVFVVGGTPMYLMAMTEGLFEGPGADPVIRERLHRRAEAEGSQVLYDELARVDPKAVLRIHRNDTRRLVRALEVYELTGQPISDLQAQWDQEPSDDSTLRIGLRRSREDQSHRTNDRVRTMFVAGLVDEVQALLNESRPLSDTARKAVGYAEVIQHLRGDVPLAEAAEMIKINTRRFAKAQRTWFKRIRSIEWTELAPDSRMIAVADDLMARHGALWTA